VVVRIYLGPSSLLLAFEVAVDEYTPAGRFVQLLRIRVTAARRPPAGQAAAG